MNLFENSLEMDKEIERNKLLEFENANLCVRIEQLQSQVNTQKEIVEQENETSTLVENRQ